jgi:hypothetical protein
MRIPYQRCLTGRRLVTTTPIHAANERAKLANLFNSYHSVRSIEQQLCNLCVSAQIVKGRNKKIKTLRIIAHRTRVRQKWFEFEIHPVRQWRHGVEDVLH